MNIKQFFSKIHNFWGDRIKQELKIVILILFKEASSFFDSDNNYGLQIYLYFYFMSMYNKKKFISSLFQAKI